jgi:hypothetical protein
VSALKKPQGKASQMASRSKEHVQQVVTLILEKEQANTNLPRYLYLEEVEPDFDSRR